MLQSEMMTLLEQLIAIESISPFDKGCQAIIAEVLNQQGFKTHHMHCAPVDNLWAEIGNGGPLLVFAGHTDVVAAGDLNQWQTPPFRANYASGKVYGRGSCDMKGALCAMIAATSRFLETNPDFPGRIGYLITSGEEGNDFLQGTPKVMEYLKAKNDQIAYCIVGEPSSTKTVGDVIKVGRRGSLTCYINIHGKQGHVAYPQLAQNPIHLASPWLAELSTIEFDRGNTYFPPTSFQITNVKAGTGEGNVIPPQLTLQANFRYSTEVSAPELKTIVENLLFKKYQLNAEVRWQHNGEPFLTQQGKLIEACQQAITLHTNIQPELSTSGGTSDGRFIAPYGVQVVELGVSNETIHQINECTDISELHTLSRIYESICHKLLCGVELI